MSPAELSLPFHPGLQGGFVYGAVLSCGSFLQMNEMEISRAAAERSLREHMGNVVEALITLTN